jgi:hypothetical protein
MRLLKEFEPELFKELRKKIVSELKPIVTPIQSEINSQVTQELRSKMPGMFHNGRSSWSGVTMSPRISTRPRDLVFINAAGTKGQVGYNYAELAGIQRRSPRPVSRTYTKDGQARTHRVNGQGIAFNAKLAKEFGKPGRFAWIRTLRRKPEIEGKVENIARDFGIKLTRRLG